MKNLKGNALMLSVINSSVYTDDEFTVDGATFRIGINTVMCAGVTGVACQEVQFFTEGVRTKSMPAISFALKDLALVKEICRNDDEFQHTLRFIVGHEIGHQVEFQRAVENGTFVQGMEPDEYFADAYSLKASNGLFDRTSYTSFIHVMCDTVTTFLDRSPQLKGGLMKVLKAIAKFEIRTIFSVREKQTLRRLSDGKTTFVTDDTAFDTIGKIVRFVEGTMLEAEKQGV